MPLQVACERLVDIVDLACACDLPADEDVIEGVLDAASDFLSNLADTRLGRCTDLYRPCRGHCIPTWECSCCHLRGIHLPGIEPSVTGVLVDGAEVDDTTYAVIINPSGQYVLERFNTDFRSVDWPLCANVLAPSTAVGTFEIEVESGMARNQLTTLAAAEIACDIFAYMAGTDHMLPAGIASAAAYGVTVNARLPFDPTRAGQMDLTGLTFTTRFLNTLPSVTGTEIIAPELLDGWNLFQRNEVVAP